MARDESIHEDNRRRKKRRRSAWKLGKTRLVKQVELGNLKEKKSVGGTGLNTALCGLASREYGGGYKVTEGNGNLCRDDRLVLPLD